MKRNTRLLVTINVALFVALLGILEFAARRVEMRRLGPRALRPPAMMDRWTAWRNTPGYDRGDIRQDRQGFRHDQDVSEDKPPNTVRIFFLGGSAAYGCEGQYHDIDPDWHKIYNRDLIDAYLEKELQQRHPERHWEVINAAVNEFRMHQHLQLIYAQLLRYHPDLVIFMDGHNDMSGLMSANNGAYDPFDSTPHLAEFESMVYPKSLRSLLLINTSWLRNNSVLFDVMYRKTLARQQEKAFGPGADPRELVNSPVRFADIPEPQQRQALANLAQIDFYPRMAERLFASLAHERIPAMFSMQPELILSPKPLTPIEARFADHTRQISRRYIVYMYEHMQPAISRLMTESAQHNGYTFVDLADTFRGVRDRVFTDYCHLTSRGNQLIAERLYQAMEPDLIPRLLQTGAAAPPASARLSRAAGSAFAR